MSGFVKAAKGLRDLFEHHVRTPGHGCNEAERVKIGACFAAFDEALRTERDLTDSDPQSATSEMEAVLEPWRAVWKVAFEPYDDGRHADDEGVAPLMPLAWPTIGDLRKLANPPAAQAIEARRAETGTGSVHESAVGNADASDTGSDTAGRE